MREKPLWERMYFDDCWTEVIRTVGYAGFPYMQLWEKLQPLTDRFGKQRVESATWHLTTFEGQMTVKPPPLAKVELRADVRKLAWQLLGPPPEQEEAFFTNRDGTPMERPKMEGSPPAPEPKPEEPPTPPKPKRARGKKGP